MRKLIIVALFGGLLLGSCSTDFTLEAPYRDIPVAYSFLSIEDSVHFVRVEKAFLEVGGDATQIAQIADSLYYDDAILRVTLEKNNNGQLFDLERVDGNVIGYPRDEGTFADSPNYLYRIAADAINLSGGQSVRLRIDREDDNNEEPIATAETTMLSPIEPRQTSPPEILKFADYQIPVSIRWQAGEEAKIFNITFLVDIEEVPTDGGPSTFRTLRWKVVENLPRDEDGSVQSINITGEDFYIFMASALEPDPSVNRRLVNLDLEYAAAGQEVADYLRIANANIGITSSQNIPVYSNIEGGRGIFTSRYVIYREGFILNAASRDSLQNGIYTRNLGFL